MNAVIHMMATALAADRNTPPLGGDGLVLAHTILNAEVMYGGGIVAIDYADEVQMASDTAGLKVIGLAGEQVSNAADGKTIAPVKRGIFRLANSATYPIPRSAIGQVCYVEDDNTVAAYSTNLVSAGLVHDVDSTGVWVDMRPAALAAAWERRPCKVASKTDSYACTDAIAFEGRTVFSIAKSSLATLTLPSAVAGMRVGVRRANAGAGYDVAVKAAAADKIEGSDGLSAAAKQVDNTVDAISDIIWWRAVDDTHWMLDNPIPTDFGSWVKNDA